MIILSLSLIVLLQIAILIKIFNGINKMIRQMETIEDWLLEIMIAVNPQQTVTTSEYYVSYN